MNEKLIYGIQQFGVGVDDADEAFQWYAKHLGADIPLFEDNALATFMAPYMGGKPRNRRAVFAVNIQGGCGFELWQFTDRKPEKPDREIQVGDLGIHIPLIKSRDIQKSYDRLNSQDVAMLSEIVTEPDGKRSFYINDLCDNILRVKEFDSWFTNTGFDTGGGYGAVIGVANIEKSLKLYADLLGYNKVIYDRSGTFEDLASLPNGKGKFRRVLLSHTEERNGGFSRLFGETQLELIQALNYSPRKIYANRYWGDIGYIHLCFDIYNMPAMLEESGEKGFPCKILSDKSFSMGKAAGQYAYVEDPDGALIKLVESYRVPLIKKLGMFINLENRNPTQPISQWLIRAMALKRKKFK